jgi:hypothetical protein
MSLFNLIKQNNTISLPSNTLRQNPKILTISNISKASVRISEQDTQEVVLSVHSRYVVPDTHSYQS